MAFRACLLTAADRLQRWQLWLAAVALVILMMVTVLDVFLRYVFNHPIRYSYDTVESTLLVFAINAMPAAFFTRRNVVIDLIDGAIGPRGTAILIRAADVLSVFCLGLLMWAMVTPALQSYQYADVKMELRLPIYVLWIAALVSLAGALFCAFVAMVARPAVASHGRAE
jgi:TRAP-type C4-dicarboxylate transport system permease small subunit